MNQIPQELDWVSRRAACTIEQIFSHLRDGAEKDVALANKAFSAPPEKPFFRVQPIQETAFSVQRLGRIKRVIFSCAQDHIVIVSEPTEQQWEYTIGLNNEGRCLLWQGETEFEQWQVRKIVLEGMFFGQ